MIEKLIKDFPQQFKDGLNINAITNAIDKQVKDLQDAFKDLTDKRSLDESTGMRLDLMGSNIGLTRAQAMNIMGEEQTLDDDLYRKLLKHKAYKNANNCTYYDLMQELKLVIGDEPITYEEVAPATITLKSVAGSLGQIPPSVPAGVSVLYENDIKTEIDFIPRFYGVDYDAPRCGTFRCGTRRV